MPVFEFAHTGPTIDTTALLAAVRNTVLEVPTSTESPWYKIKAEMDKPARWSSYFIDGGPPADTIPDLSQRSHAIETEAITALFIVGLKSDCQLSVNDGNILRIAAYTHDLGELKKGDLSWHDQQSEAARSQASDTERVFFTKEHRRLFPGLSESERKLLCKIYLKIGCPNPKPTLPPAQPSDTFSLPVLFQAVEKIGYLSGAAHAFRIKDRNMLWHAMMASVLFHRFDAISFCARTYPNATAHALAPFKDVVLDACRFFQNTTNQQRALKAEFNAVLAGKIGAFNPGVHRVKVTEWQGLLETLRSQKMELDPLKNS